MYLKNACDGAYNSMDVRFTKSCDNNCSFCIDKRGLGSLGSTRVSEMIEATKTTNADDVLILGGEPFLLPDKLLAYVRGIYGTCKHIYITTSLPATMLDHPAIEHIMELIDGLNVSIQSTDWQKNNEILKAKSKHNRLEILSLLNKCWSDKIRVSINLTRGGIDTASKLTSSLDDLVDIGCKHIKINELQHSPDLYISYESLLGIKLDSPYSHGCQRYVENYRSARILLKRSCFVVEQSQKADINDLIKAVYKRLFHRPKNKFNVLYEDASLQNTWLENNHK